MEEKKVTTQEVDLEMVTVLEITGDLHLDSVSSITIGDPRDIVDILMLLYGDEFEYLDESVGDVLTIKIKTMPKAELDALEPPDEWQ